MKKIKDSWTRCIFLNLHVHENVNKANVALEVLKCYDFCFWILEGESVFERLDKSVLQQAQGDDSQEGLYSCL